LISSICMKDKRMKDKVSAKEEKATFVRNKLLEICEKLDDLDDDDMLEELGIEIFITETYQNMDCALQELEEQQEIYLGCLILEQLQ
jgi:hypothetical protein